MAIGCMDRANARALKRQRVIELHQKGLSREVIAERLGISRDQVRLYLQEKKKKKES